MLPSLPQASIRTLLTNSHAKIAEHAQSFCRCVAVRCTSDACALEARQRFVTERGKKKRKPKTKPRPHCLGNNLASKSMGKKCSEFFKAITIVEIVIFMI